MNDINIKRVELKDLEQLQTVGRQIFFETFAESNTAENMKKYLDEGFSMPQLTNEINNPSSEFYFAILNNQVIGYLKINFGQAQTEMKNDNTLEIERIYVLKEFHGKKVGQVLYDKAFEIAKQSKVDYMWLGVWEENPKAINFYKKNGFVEFDKHIFMLGDDKQTDIMFQLFLKNV